MDYQTIGIRMNLDLEFDMDLLKARIYHGLKSLQSKGDILEPRYLEIAICESFGFKHVGDSAFYADGINEPYQMSIKTRTLSPHTLKKKESRDFQSHPSKFLGPQKNQKFNSWLNGVEIVQRRQKLDLENDITSDPYTIGSETLKGFISNIQESLEKYNTKTTYEVICIHGYDKTKKFYLISLFWKIYEALDVSSITWIREGYGVSGYYLVDGVYKKVCERVNGNAKREATCFKEYKDLTKYDCSANIKLPLPDLWKFDKKTILDEIYLKETLDAYSNLFTE